MARMAEMKPRDSSALCIKPSLALRRVGPCRGRAVPRSEEHTSELQSLTNLVCRLLLEKKKKQHNEWPYKRQIKKKRQNREKLHNMIHQQLTARTDHNGHHTINQHHRVRDRHTNDIQIL